MTGKKTADDYVASKPEWAAALNKLRTILIKSGLVEEIKWGIPCYTLNNENVASIAAFKRYCGIWFFQGAFLSDPKGVLVNASEGKTRGQRQWRFERAAEIDAGAVCEYVKEAIANAEAGRKIVPERGKAVVIPPELGAALKADKNAMTAFAGMTPGKQREYADYVAGAKREATKKSRVEKILPMIAQGAGLHDKYRNC